MARDGVQTGKGEPRVDWVDVAKGVCIVMVVMMHSTLGVEKAAGAEGFMNAFVAFARPFRMPDFFLISGLFLALVIDRDWRLYLDRKVVHFAYFYVLWLLIQGAFKWPAEAAEGGPGAVLDAFLWGLVEPFGTLWFIYLLPIFFVFAKLVRNWPPLIVLAFAAALETFHGQRELFEGAMASLGLDPTLTVPNEFCARLFYVMLGWYGARYVFRFAEWAGEHRLLACGALLTWALVNGLAVFGGVSTLPGMSLALGVAGSLAIVGFAAIVAGSRTAEPLRYAGERSIVIYLAFFLPMAATRTLLLATGVIEDIGWISLVTTVVGVLTPLAFHWAVMRTGKGTFLFVRPRAFHLAPPRAASSPDALGLRQTS